MTPWLESGPTDEMRRPIERIEDRPQPPLPYSTPTVESIGYWSNLTLQQSVPVGFFSNL